MSSTPGFDMFVDVLTLLPDGGIEEPIAGAVWAEMVGRAIKKAEGRKVQGEPRNLSNYAAGYNAAIEHVLGDLRYYISLVPVAIHAVSESQEGVTLPPPETPSA